MSFSFLAHGLIVIEAIMEGQLIFGEDEKCDSDLDSSIILNLEKIHFLLWLRYVATDFVLVAEIEMKFFVDLVSMKERIHLFNSILIVFETSLRRQGHNVREVVTINVQIHRISCLQYKQEIYKKGMKRVTSTTRY